MLKLRRLLFNKRAQSTAEYAVIIALVLGAVIAMQTYVKRGIAKKLELRTNAFMEKGGAPDAAQYEPYYLDQTVVTDSGSEVTERERGSEGKSRYYESDATTVRNIRQTQQSY